VIIRALGDNPFKEPAMKALVLFAIALAIGVSTVSGARACSGTPEAASPTHIGAPKSDKAAAGDSDMGVLFGLLLGIVLADPMPAAKECLACIDTR
jgi:hypothetical protein